MGIAKKLLVLVLIVIASRVSADPLSAGGDHAGEDHSSDNHAGETLVGVNLTSANLSVSDFSGASMFDAILVGADLRGTNFTGADLEDSLVADAQIDTHTLFNGAQLVGTDFSGRDLRNSTLSGAASLPSAVRGSNLSGLSFVTNFESSSFFFTGWDGAVLLGTDFAGVNIGNVLFDNVDARGADFSRIRTDDEPRFWGADLRRASFEMANLVDVDVRLFTGADLRDANLRDMEALGTGWGPGVRLGGADLQHGDFRLADFAGVDFAGAFVFGADFTGATNLDLTGAILAKHEPVPEPSTLALTAVVLLSLVAVRQLRG